MTELDRQLNAVCKGEYPYTCTVCGSEPLGFHTQWVTAGEILCAAWRSGDLQNEPRDPRDLKHCTPTMRTYVLGCSKTGDNYAWGAGVNLSLYGGNRKFFVNGVGPTTAT